MTKIQNTFSNIWLVLALIAVWDIYVRWAGFNAIVLPSPGAVFVSIVVDYDLYLPMAMKTLWVSVVGLILGTLLGAAFGIFGWLSAIASGMVSVSSIVVRSVPIVVFVPILATLIGYNTGMVIILVALMSFFPAFVMVSSGLASLSAAANDVSAVYGATKMRKLRYIALPAAMPNLFASVRLSASRAILAAMVAEFLTGIRGLGSLFLLARADLNNEVALGAAMVAAIAALLLYYAAEWLERSVNLHIN